jgi:hypothetical protein
VSPSPRSAPRLAAPSFPAPIFASIRRASAPLLLAFAATSAARAEPAPAPETTASSDPGAAPVEAAPAVAPSDAVPPSDTPPADGKPYSPYELATIEQELTAVGGAIERAPEGKIIERVILRPLDVLEERDPLPGFAIDVLNAFHATSRPYTIKRELLSNVGQPYHQVTVDETARNLRSIRQFSVVLCVPLVGSRPDRVRLLVITKDIWSLRLNSDFRIAGGGLESLVLAPSEENLFGTHHSVSLRFSLDPASYSLGTTYRVPRIADSRLEAAVSNSITINRASGELEGGSFAFAYGQPLWSTRTDWSWITSVSWQGQISRRFVGGEVATFDSPLTEDDDAIPFQYRSDITSGAWSVTRSFGWLDKNDLSAGAEIRRAEYRLDADASSFAPGALADFSGRFLPVSDTRIYPFFRWSAYSNRFVSLVDFNTLGLVEDYRLGHDLYVKAYPVLRELGSTRSFAGLGAGASYTAPFGDGLVRAFAESLTEAEPERLADASVTVGFRAVTPRFGIGRLVLDAVLQDRYRNHLNRRSSIGGDTRLRGYPSGAFLGESALAYNVELRTRPIELWTVQLGGVAFFDAGTAWDEGEPVDIRQGVGLGLRLLFPQLDRTVMRIDWGVPLQLEPSLGIDSHLPGEFVVTFKQAFGMPSIAPPGVL